MTQSFKGVGYSDQAQLDRILQILPLRYFQERGTLELSITGLRFIGSRREILINQINQASLKKVPQRWLASLIDGVMFFLILLLIRLLFVWLGGYGFSLAEILFTAVFYTLLTWFLSYRTMHWIMIEYVEDLQTRTAYFLSTGGLFPARRTREIFSAIQQTLSVKNCFDLK